ncbi:hypothetical protein [Thermoflexus sp.]
MVPWNPEPRPIAQALHLPDGAWVGIVGARLRVWGRLRRMNGARALS